LEENVIVDLHLVSSILGWHMAHTFGPLGRFQNSVLPQVKHAPGGQELKVCSSVLYIFIAVHLSAGHLLNWNAYLPFDIKHL
jgi:hypothetical protein